MAIDETSTFLRVALVLAANVPIEPVETGSRAAAAAAAVEEHVAVLADADELAAVAEAVADASGAAGNQAAADEVDVVLLARAPMMARPADASSLAGAAEGCDARGAAVLTGAQVY